MPFGDYDDFADCVRKNQDKSDPEAYCAVIKRNVEGHMKSLATRSVGDVEIFSIGTWTDSANQTREFTVADLDAMIKAAGDPVPLKVGHTSAAFNAKLAEALGVPVELLTGEKGEGAPRLGETVRLRRKDGKLVADFVAVPEAIADFIEGGQFNAVSVELVFKDGKPHLAATALLGAEAPAVDNLKPLNLAKFAEAGGAWWTFPLEVEAKRVELPILKLFRRAKAGLELERKEKPMAKDVKVDLAQFREALELPETATAEDIIGAIAKIKEPAPDPVLGQFKKRLDDQAQYIARLEHKDRVAQYSQKAQKWTAVPGKPEELGEKLATVHETAGEAHAQALVAAYQSVQESADRVGLMTPLGTSRSGNLLAEVKDTFQDEMDKWAEDNKDTDPSRAKTLSHFAINRPKEFGAYRQRVRAAINGS